MNQPQYNNVSNDDDMQHQPVPFRLPLALRHLNLYYFNGVSGAPKADRMQYRTHHQGNLPPKNYLISESTKMSVRVKWLLFRIIC